MFPRIGSIRGPGPVENETLATWSAVAKDAILETSVENRVSPDKHLYLLKFTPENVLPGGARK